MHRLASLSTVLAAFGTVLALGSTASAADPTRVRSQFYDMGVTNITSEVRTPGLEYFKGKDPAVFQRMLKLRKDMLPGIASARKDLVFK